MIDALILGTLIVAAIAFLVLIISSAIILGDPNAEDIERIKSSWKISLAALILSPALGAVLVVVGPIFLVGALILAGWRAFR